MRSVVRLSRKPRSVAAHVDRSFVHDDYIDLVPRAGPKAPDGLEANWIQTSGKRPLPAARFYGPTDKFNDRSFKLADFELVS